MAGWLKEKRRRVEQAFRLFLNRCYVNSKDSGRICIGDHLYDAQVMAITQIFDALEADVHDIYILKSRQLGISTIIRALMIFLLGSLKGLKGAIIFDTDTNKVEARAEIEVMIQDLPPSLHFSKVKSSNRAGLTLSNDSKVLFMAAGVRKTKSSGVLGRSVGLSLAHCSELCSWDNDEGLEAFRNSLSEVNPDRLYIYESTARGFNQWWKMWQEARSDYHHRKCIFIGWWAKPTQRIDRDSPDFALYGETPPSDKELAKIKQVKEQYDYQVTEEQLAWYRRKMDPVAVWSDLEKDEADKEEPLKMQEQPWTEEEAFQQSGAVFFGAKALTEMTHSHVKRPLKRYFFWVGQEFFDMRAFEATTPKMTELKVWEEPDDHSHYCIGVDPAYGENPKNDRSCIQILKCYADGIDQVAEYAWPLVTTQQLAWVLAALMGWYGRGNNVVRYALELNGPGGAVFTELKSLRQKIEGRLRYDEYESRGLQDIFRNVKTYIWSRDDSMGAGYNYHLKTTNLIKVPMMERLRDFISNGTLRVRSVELVEEMKTIEREEDTIKAHGSLKDDRVVSMAFAVHCWEKKARAQLITTRATRQAEQARKSLAVTDQVALFQQNQLQSFFDQKRVARMGLARSQAYQAWRYGGRRY